MGDDFLDNWVVPVVAKPNDIHGLSTKQPNGFNGESRYEQTHYACRTRGRSSSEEPSIEFSHSGVFVPHTAEIWDDFKRRQVDLHTILSMEHCFRISPQFSGRVTMCPAHRMCTMK